MLTCLFLLLYNLGVLVTEHDFIATAVAHTEQKVDPLLSALQPKDYTKGNERVWP